MYSYLHRFHAGNFADCHKHASLIYLINYLKLKNTPFCVMDAFAGEGSYALDSAESLKNSEFKQGILKYFQDYQQFPHAQWTPYLTLVSDYNLGSDPGAFKTYPGSPSIIAKLLRPQDRGIFIENHPACYPILKKNFRSNSQISVHKRDAYEALNALVPFKEKRGIILIDPSYEVKQEYHNIAEIVQTVYQKFSNGIFVIWYPILDHAGPSFLKKQLLGHPSWKIFNHEMIPQHAQGSETGLRGSGLIVINPPWKMQEIFS